jgi:hypothetical protein
MLSMAAPDPVTRNEIRAEMERARATFHQLLADASDEDMRRASQGTRWTNEQLLFHMLFGYLIVRAVRWLVRGFGLLPDGVSRGYAWLLNVASRPFHTINYWGSRCGALVFGRDRMGRKMDQVIDSLERHLDRETDSALARRMHFPVRWDPFFTDAMTLADVYHYATQHYDFHRQQLTVSGRGKQLPDLGSSAP